MKAVGTFGKTFLLSEILCDSFHRSDVFVKFRSKVLRKLIVSPKEDILLYSVTKNASYLDYAKRGAEWIINTGIVYGNIGAYVLYNPPRQAAFGIYGYAQRDVGTLVIDL